MRFPETKKFVFALVVLGLTAGCSTLPRNEQAAREELHQTTLEAAERLLKRADAFDRSPGGSDTAMVYRLRAAEIAWEHLAARTPGASGREDVAAPGGDGRLAMDIHARASGEAARHAVRNGGKPATFSFAGWLYRLESATSGNRIVPPSSLSDVEPARNFPHRLLKNWHAGEGVGEPLVPTTQPPEDPDALRFAPNRGYLMSATAMLLFADGNGGAGGRSVRLEIIETTAPESRTMAGHTHPLAYDLTAPLYNEVAGIPELLRALSGLFIADRAEARLIMLEPYDPERTPVVFVHGLISHPLMWRDVVNELRSVPELRERYQLWAFFYPTGWPITYSAKRLRDEMRVADAAFGPLDDMVFVGHSMGGLLSRLQIISPERKIWDANLGDQADRLHESLPADSLVREMLLFDANPGIDRAVFISTPHRGSRIADMTVVGLVMKFIRLPGQVTRTILDLPAIDLDRHRLNSIASLSPSNPTLLAMDGLPIEAVHHSIIGDRGRGDTPNSSDGVVQYWSSHLESAASELIVPSDHGAHDDPAAIAEVGRLLALHAGLPIPDDSMSAAVPALSPGNNAEVRRDRGPARRNAVPRPLRRW